MNIPHSRTQVLAPDGTFFRDWYLFFNSLVRTGVFTPTIIGSSTAGSQTYDSQVGRYTRVGNTVTFWLFVDISAKDAGIAGNVLIGGLPFDASSDLNQAVSVGDCKGVNLTAGYTQTAGIVLAGARTIQLQQLGDNVTGAAVAVSAIAADTSLTVAGSYLIQET